MIPKTRIARAHTTEEYVGMIEQALDEVWDLRQSIEYDEEYMSDARAFIDELENSLKAVYNDMKAGTYQFANGDLPYMTILEKYHEALIPFKFLLKRINETHMKGLDV